MGTAIQAAELLFGRYRRQILALLLLRPEESFYVRELERLSGMRPGPLHRELSALAETGLVRRVPHGNQVRYQANRDAPIYRELAAIFRKTAEPAGRPDSALEAREPDAAYRVQPPFEPPVGSSQAVSASLKRLAVSRRDLAAICRKWAISRMSLFGSVTRKEFRPDSDVDVLVEFPRGSAPSLFGTVHLRDELSALFGGRRVDVVTPAILRNPLMRKSVEQDLQVVYEAG